MPSRDQEPTPTVHLVVGPVGAGKSTYARKLAGEHRALSLNLDEWMVVLFGDDVRPEAGSIEWYIERTKRCVEQIWRTTENAMLAGTNVVLEVGLIQREPRQRFYDRIDIAGFSHVVHLLDAPRDERRRRVVQRNQQRGSTFFMAVPAEFFELASDLWEEPEQTEIDSRRFVAVNT